VKGGYRTLRAFAAILLTSGLLMPAALRPPTASAQEPEAFVSIRLTSMAPALPKPDSTVTLTGNVTNISDVQLTNLQAIFWRAPGDPILNAEALNRTLASAANEPLGARLENNYQNIPAETDRTLEPGETTTFTLKATVAELAFPLADSVYLIGVHVRGRITLNGADITLGRARTFLPMQTQKTPNTLQMTSVVILNSRPSLLRGSEFVNNHLATEVASDGRLDRLIDAADADNVSFAVDPALIDELRAMKGGYTVRGSDASTTDGQSAASRWLDKFDSLKSNRDGFRLIYGSPDIAALVHSGQARVLDQAQLAGRTVDGLSGLPILVLPTGGAADAQTLAAAQDLDPTAILLSDVSTTQPRPLLATGKAPVVSFTANSFGGGPGPDPRNTAVHIQQRMLADTWIEANASPAGSTLGRVRVVTNAAQAAGDAGSDDPPWIRRGTLSELLRSQPADWDQQLNYPKAARADELSDSQVRSIRQLARSQATYADLLADPDTEKVAAATSLARAASGTWRGARGAMRAFVRPQIAELDDILHNKVEIRTSRKVTTVARQGRFPITVRNTLPASDSPGSLTNAVRVRLVFNSSVEQRLTVRPLDLGVIRAEANVAATAEVDAKANGTVPVTAQLTTTTGRLIGRPMTIQVTATQAGTTGWIIVLISGPVLLAGVALRIRQVARERAAAAVPVPPDALSSKPPVDRDAETLDV
jgi:Family of unknown function (DUF6049)